MDSNFSFRKKFLSSKVATQILQKILPYNESSDENTASSQMIKNIQDLVPELRILVIGRENSGKTAVIQRVGDSHETPIIYDEKGIQYPASVFNGSTALRSLHNINLQITYKSKPGFIFHDSIGFESSSTDELKIVKSFLQAMLAKPNLKDRIHAIWCCIPADSDQVATKTELSFFRDNIAGTIPVILLFTKLDGRIIERYNTLRRKENMEIRQAIHEAPLRARKALEEEYLPVFKNTPYPPVIYVALGYMNKPETKCSELLNNTVAALNRNVLKGGLVWLQPRNPPPRSSRQPIPGRSSPITTPVGIENPPIDHSVIANDPSTDANPVTLLPPPSNRPLPSESSDKTTQLQRTKSGIDIATLKGHPNEMDSTVLQIASDQRSVMIASQLTESSQISTNSQEDLIASTLASVPFSNDITGSVLLTHPDRIGLGGFGELFLGNHTNLGKVALKRPHKFFDDATIRRFLREVDMWCSVSHRYVLPCLGTCKIGPDVYVVSPFIGNGDLRSCMIRGDVLNRSKLLYEVVEALAHLHHRGIVHGDVKAQNVLVSDDGSALLCDFGLAKAFNTVTSTESQGSGSVRWMAPELFKNGSRSLASDVYSLGITIAEVLSGQPPFQDIPNNAAVMYHVMIDNGRPPKTPPHSPEGRSYLTLWETAEKCWATEAEDRPYMAQVLGMLFPLTQEKN